MLVLNISRNLSRHHINPIYSIWLKRSMRRICLRHMIRDRERGVTHPVGDSATGETLLLLTGRGVQCPPARPLGVGPRGTWAKHVVPCGSGTAIVPVPLTHGSPKSELREGQQLQSGGCNTKQHRDMFCSNQGAVERGERIPSPAAGGTFRLWLQNESERPMHRMLPPSAETLSQRIYQALM